MSGIVELHSAQLDRVILAGLWPGQHDGLVATQAGRFVDWMRIDPPVLKIGFGTRHKEGLSQMQGMESVEVDIAPIHDIETAGLEGDPVENVHIVELAIGDMDEGRNVAPQVEQRMEFDRALAFAKAGPGKERQAQIDGGRIERIDRMRQFQAEAVLGIEFARCLDQAESEILIDAPVAVLVGVGQRALGNAAANAQVVELGGMRAKTGLDVAQAFAVGQLREGHAQELVEVRESERRIASGVLGHAAPEGVQRQMIHQLGKHQLSRMH